MDKRYEPLFQPWRIGNVEIKNRIVMLPMEGTNMIQWEAKTGFVKNIGAFYRDRKDNNIGLFIPGLIPLVSIVGEKWIYEHPEVFKPVRPIVKEIHDSGAKIFFQLSAGAGRSMILPQLLKLFVKKGLIRNLSSKLIMSKWWWSAPDDNEPNVWDPDVRMGEFTSDMISRFVYAFGQTAKLCKDAGVDGVEIHAVHEGYLLDQFAMPYTNHRNDCYGGSLENRLRFACEVVKEIKKVCGDDYPVSLRYSVCSMTRGFNKGAVPGEVFTEVGRSMEESQKAIQILEEAGYDMFNCDNGTYDAWYWAHPPVYAPLNMNLSYVEHIRQFTSKPVVCAGRMQPEEAADSIAAGKIDAMGIGRQLLCDPEFVTKIKEERMEEIRPCIACHGACLPFCGLNGKGTDIDPLHPDMGRCVLNPWTNNELKYSLKPARHPKKIAIIGGGIGGMETAIQASKRGHEVDLYEKTDRLGGAFIAASAMSFKEKDKQLLQWYEHTLKQTDVRIHFNTEISDLDDLNADIIVVAVGAKAKTLPIPGIEHAITAIDFLNGSQECGENVAVIGGGLTGCEIAYELALKGKKPVIVEATENILGAKGICMANSSMLKELLRYHEVPVYTSSTVESIDGHSITLKTSKGTAVLRADTVILSVGYLSDKRFAEEKETKKKNKVFFVGDCDQVGSLKTVIRQAYETIQKISY
ncbi:MAG: FAD-dependent oxidoreductase [Erysipelotrichaceae bacterium]|nr:FAD-dependent oxidoreductase [Erysipelotrichaceae bacterium]